MSRSKTLFRSDDSLLSSVITLLNSSVGVVALAMPYCFQQCGVLLSVVFIALSAICCSASCDVLIQLCFTHKVSSIEKACFRHLGLLGKLVTELSIIGLMFGFIIGFDVSIADLGVGILKQLPIATFLHPMIHTRAVVLALVTLLILPLCLTPNVQSLAKFSAFAVLFYTLLMFHMIVILAAPRFLSGSPLSHMIWWRPVGLLQCAPIFFGSIFCQTQLHTIYHGLPEPSVSAMRRVVHTVVAVIALAYSLFGFFGYAAFAAAAKSAELAGNIFMMYPQGVSTFLVKAGFLFTITVSIPLILFPLRQSLNSFFYHQHPSSFSDLEISVDGSLPTRRFKSMTLIVIILCFLLSLTTNRIEVIIRLTSSLVGSLVGFILPPLATIYSSSSYHTAPSTADKSRRVSVCLLTVGLVLLVLGMLSVRTAPVTVEPVSDPRATNEIHSDGGTQNAMPKMEAPVLDVRARLPAEPLSHRVQRQPPLPVPLDSGRGRDSLHVADTGQNIESLGQRPSFATGPLVGKNPSVVTSNNNHNNPVPSIKPAIQNHDPVPQSTLALSTGQSSKPVAIDSNGTPTTTNIDPNVSHSHSLPNDNKSVDHNQANPSSIVGNASSVVRPSGDKVELSDATVRHSVNRTESLQPGTNPTVKAGNVSLSLDATVASSANQTPPKVPPASKPSPDVDNHPVDMDPKVGTKPVLTQSHLLPELASHTNQTARPANLDSPARVPAADSEPQDGVHNHSTRKLATFVMPVQPVDDRLQEAAVAPAPGANKDLQLHAET